MEYNIEEMKSSDWEQVKNIYLEGIETNVATFQTETPAWEDWNKGHLASCRLVARSADNIFGWTVLSPSSSRCCYRGVAEISIYVDKNIKVRV